MAQQLDLKLYQDSTAERAVAQECLAIFADPGLGKTVIALETFRRLREFADVSAMLVVAPLRVCYSVWPREVERWEPFKNLRVQVLHGATRRPEYLRGADVYVINPESLKWLREQSWQWPEMLVVDESTRFKRKSSQRSRHLGALIPRFRRRYILTGTPAPNGLENLHGQFYILDEGRALYPTVGEFRERWEIQVPTGSAGYMKWRLRRGAAEEIHRAVAPLSVRLDAKDHLDLPKLVTAQVSVALPPEARALYDKLRKEMVIRLKQGDVVAKNAGVLTAKCRQVANGAVYLNDLGQVAPGVTRRSEVVHRAKADALVELVEELQGKPLLVSYEHKHELALILETLKPLVGKVPHLGGDVSGPEGARIERAWNAGEIPVLPVQPQSGSLGLNLQDGGYHLCFFALPWDLEHYDQLIRRLLRQGQAAEIVFVYHLVAEGTVDLTVLKALERKDGEQRGLLDFLRDALLGVPEPLVAAVAEDLLALLSP